MDTPTFMAGKKDAQDKAAESASTAYHSVAELERRLRTLEERYSTLDRRSQVTEENMLNSDRKIKAEIKMINEELPDINSRIEDVTDKIKALVRELQDFAKVEDVEVIRKYLNLIEPLGFVTQNEVERLVSQAVRDAINEQLEQSDGKD